MSEERTIGKTGLYEGTVQTITETVKPHLHHVTEEFVAKSVDKYAKDNPKYARMIEFEVRRRGDGAGLTQDVAEPMLWVGVKTGAALAIAAVTETIKNNKARMVGFGAALGIIANNAVELFRLVPRYKAGLQGSLEMAKDRWRSIEETGVDPFDQQSRQISVGALPEGQQDKPKTALRGIAPKQPVTATDLMDRAQQKSNQAKTL